MSAATIQRNQVTAYQRPVNEVLATRLASYGRNELTEEKPLPWWLCGRHAQHPEYGCAKPDSH
jgi:Cation transporter/ATPase, N-terminus